MPLLDTKVLRTQQVFEELAILAANKDNLQNNSVAGFLKTEVNAVVTDQSYVAVMDNSLRIILACTYPLADRSLLQAID